MLKYCIVGAFDRHNYGDLLFPIVHSNFIRSIKGNNVTIQYYSVSNVDLSIIGGFKTIAVKSALKRNMISENDIVIMSGGDILCVDWVQMIGHISSPPVFLLFRIIKKLIGFELANYLIRLLYSQVNSFPYILSDRNVSAKIYYTGVSGSGFGVDDNKKHVQKVVEELVRAEHISVRDLVTFKFLNSHGVRCTLVPDTALLISDYISITELNKRGWKASILQDNMDDINKFIVFQAGNNFVKNDVKFVSNQLAEISKMTGLNIVLLPIGRATGHEDHKVLMSIYYELSKRGCPVGIQNSSHILDIMATLASCESYIGTSLHGAISAYTYGHKVCGISTKKVIKLGAFLCTWISENDYIAVQDLSFKDQFLHLITNTCSISSFEELKNQKALVYEDLKKYCHS